MNSYPSDQYIFDIKRFYSFFAEHLEMKHIRPEKESSKLFLNKTWHSLIWVHVYEFISVPKLVFDDCTYYYIIDISMDNLRDTNQSVRTWVPLESTVTSFKRVSQYCIIIVYIHGKTYMYIERQVSLSTKMHARWLNENVITKSKIAKNIFLKHLYF